jgi:hypothetical protein
VSQSSDRIHERTNTEPQHGNARKKPRQTQSSAHG